MIHVFLCATDLEEGLPRALSHNLFDFLAEHIVACHSIWDVVQITVGSTMDQLLDAARESDAEWGIFYKLGTIFRYSHIPRIRQSLLEGDEDTVVIGHILDRGDQYYELHDQSFVLNLTKLKQFPPYVKFTPAPGIKNEIWRSDDNYHHDYTPLWVEAKGVTKGYANPAPGADLISHALEFGTVRPYSPEERQNKGYIYPEYSEGFYSNVGRIEADIAKTKSRFFMFNTDMGWAERFNYMDSISRMVIPASGFLPFELLRDMNPTDDFKFVFYDNSDTARWMYQYILDEWDGQDIHSLVSKLSPEIMGGPKAVDEEWNAMMDRFGGKSEWLSFFNNYRKRRWYRTVDLFNSYDKESFINLYEGHADTTLYSFSNIYWYGPTAIFRPYHERIKMFQRHLDFLQERTPDLNLFFSLPMLEYGGKAKDVDWYPVLEFPWRNDTNLVDETINLL